MSRSQRILLLSMVVIVFVVYSSAVALLSGSNATLPTLEPTLAAASKSSIEQVIASEVPQVVSAINQTVSNSQNTTVAYRPNSNPNPQPVSESAQLSEVSQPIAGQLVLQFNASADTAAREAYIASLGGTIIQTIDALNTVIISVPQDIIAHRLPKSDLVQVAEADYTVNAALTDTPNDPLFAEQWGLNAMNVPRAWSDLSSDAPGVIVAVVDSGICSSHPELAGRVIGGQSFVSDASTEDEFGHGCAISGAIAANMNDASGIAGVAPHAQIMPLRVLDERGVGSYSAVAAAIVYAADQGASIINLSLGGSVPSQVLEDAVNYAAERGTVLIAAAGNTGSSTVLYPAAYASVVAVGSVNQERQRSPFSSTGVTDVFAPGEGILTTGLNATTVTVNGTSIATAYVSGLAALEIAFDRSLVLDGGVARYQGNSDVVLTGELPSYVQISADVTDAIASDGSARVLVALKLPISAQGVNPPLSVIAQTQDDMLAQLADNFDLAHQFSSVAAFSGVLNENGLNTLKNSPTVEAVYLDEETQAAGIPSVNNIGVPAVQAGAIGGVSLTGAGVNVAVIDSGIKMTNSAVANSVVAQHCFSSINGCPGDANTANTAPDDLNHGTNISAIITAPDGVAPEAGIVALRVLDSFGRGYASDWIAALDYIKTEVNANRLQVDVVNMSLGSLKLYKANQGAVASCDSFFPVESAVIQSVLALDIPIFAATGNQGSPDSINAPACFTGVIAVGAYYDRDVAAEPDSGSYYANLGGNWPDCQDTVTNPIISATQQTPASEAYKVTCFSNGGPWVDVLAPGAQIIIGNTGGSGTSQASPHAAGVAALMFQAENLNLSTLPITPTRIEAVMRTTGGGINDTRTGLAFRRLDAVDALTSILNPTEFINCQQQNIIGTTEAQCDVLVKIYDTMGGMAWVDQSGWKASNNPCSWYGVVCDGSGNVTDLRLFYNNLRGPIPTEIGNLTSLTSLRFEGNRLTGVIPPSLGNLINLYELALNITVSPSLGNNFNSSTIPPELGNLVNLRTLILYGCNLTGPIPASFGNLVNLERVDLRANTLNGELPASLVNLINLDYFLLSSNYVTGNLPEWVVNHPTLTRADFAYNNFYGSIPLPRASHPLQYLLLNQNQFSGGIPPQLGLLTNLLDVNLSNNPLGGTLPSQLGNLTSLQTLWIGSANLSGSIPSQFGNMTSLVNLNLGTNKLSGEIPTSLGDLPNLNVFNVEDNQLTGGIPSGFGTMPYLRDFNAYFNQLTGVIDFSNPNLEGLNLYFNHFTRLQMLPTYMQSYNEFGMGIGIGRNDINYFSPEIQALYFPNGVNIQDNQIDYASLPTDTQNWLQTNFFGYLEPEQRLPIPFTVAGNQVIVPKQYLVLPPSYYALYPTLQVVGQEENTLTQNGSLFEINYGSLTNECNAPTTCTFTLANLVPGRRYDVFVRGVNEIASNSNNTAWRSQSADPSNYEEIYGPGTFDPLNECLTIINILERAECQALYSLYASTNGASWINKANWAQDENVCGWYGITCASRNGFNSVIRIDLPGNNLQGILPEDLSALLSLEVLTLRNNQLTGPLPSALAYWLNLQELDLSDNQLMGEIPDLWGNYSGLITLDLSSNRFSGAIPSIASATTLETVNLSNNRLLGSIPPSLFSALPNLQELNLSYNQLSGEIPSTIGQTTRLQDIHLGNNKLTGSIPVGITNLVNLQSLLLNTNLFSGTLPIGLGNLDALVTFIANNNQLTGTLPADLGDMASLNWLDLQVNKFSGGIPPELGDLLALERLQLNENQLSGSIPSQLGSIATLRLMHLDYNKLSGSIPPELGNLTSLNDLSLSNNRLTGSIPGELGTLANLIYLNMGANLLTGSIPPQLGNLNLLELMSLANNRLSGAIPPEFANLSSLNSLYLENNQLTGGIPSELSSLSNLQILRLQNNLLTGGIPSVFDGENLPRLEDFDASNNRLQGSVIDGSLNTIGGLGSEGGGVLNLMNNQIFGSEATISWLRDNEVAHPDGQIDYPAEIRVVEYTPEGTVVGFRPRVLNPTYGGIINSPRRYEAFCGPTYFGGNPLVASLDERIVQVPVNQITIPNIAFGQQQFCEFRTVWEDKINGGEIVSPYSPILLIESTFSASFPVEIVPASFEVDVPDPLLPENLDNLCSEATGRTVTFGGSGRTITFGGSGRTMTFGGSGRTVTFGGSGTLTADTSGSGFDTVLSVWRVPASVDILNPTEFTDANAEFVTCNDNTNQLGDPGDPNGIERPPTSPSFTSQVTVPFDRDFDLYFVVYANNEESGRLQFNITGEEQPLVESLEATEVEALTTLYGATGGSNWTNDTNWFDTANPCNWYGVLCGPAPQSFNGVNAQTVTDTVIGINLSANGLRGTLPPIWNALPNLQSLNVSYNALTGEVPPPITTLEDLQSLNLGFNALKTSDAAVGDFLETKQADWDTTQNVPPTDLNTSNPDDHGFTLNFTPIAYVGNAGYYEAYCSISDNGPFFVNNRTTDKLGSTIVLTDLMPNTSYFCHIRTITLPHSIQTNLLASEPSVLTQGTTTNSADSDGDGVTDSLDECPLTPGGQTVNNVGCSNSQLDDDTDGVVNSADQCPNTPPLLPDQSVNPQGCADFELDSDTDGVFNNVDLCINTPLAEISQIDVNGCGPSEIDSDGDTLFNNVDQCDFTPSGEIALINASGCGPSERDSDGDLVNDALDICIATPIDARPVNAVGCADVELDSDDDGVNDLLDLCELTPPQALVNTNGCAATQLDSDGDTVNDAVDQCTNTPASELPADGNGCSISQRDSDGDTVKDNLDLCPATPENAPVNINGCALSQLDSDSDLVNDALDSCPNTPVGESVNGVGCSPSQLDSDNDLVNDALDLCANTPPNTPVNTNGCALSQLDSDSDGVYDNADACPNTPLGSLNVGATGCAPSELDDDGDNVYNDVDQCPETPALTPVDGVGCPLPPPDDDADGIANTSDLCPLTPVGEVPNANGCSASQRDTDGDGYFDNIDVCLNTPSGAAVNLNGCALVELDSDVDLVNDALDLCPSTPLGEPVDLTGCSASQRDSDNDTVKDNLDACANTPLGAIINANGCALSQLDSDTDGVNDALDLCAATLSGLVVDMNGCHASQLDTDSDGVNNAIDQCPNTVGGQAVDGVGCSIAQRDSDGDSVNDALDQCPNTPIGTTVNGVGCPTGGNSGTVTVINQTLSPNVALFRFSLKWTWFRLDNDSNTATYADRITLTNLRPGSYRLSEHWLPWNWVTTSITCTEGTNTLFSFVYNLRGRETQAANLNVRAGQHIICTFTQDQFATLTVQKFIDTNGNSIREDGEIRPNGWQFTLYQSGVQVGRPITGSQSGKSVFERLLPGTYNVCETTKTGFVAQSCQSVTLTSGQKLELPFANVRNP